jgi:ABC-2 type transport system permease protein
MSAGPSAAPQQVFLLIARREFVERVRDRGFQVSTLVTTLIVVGLIVANSLFGRSTKFDLAVTAGPASAVIARQVQTVATLQGVTVNVHTYPTEAAARAAVRSGSADAAITPGSGIVVKAEPDQQLIGLIESVAGAARIRAALAEAGLSSAQIDALMRPAALAVTSLEPVDPNSKAKSAVAFVGVILLYGQLFGYGVWVATGVVEEKASRVVEILLSTIRPRQLLAGKILGIGVLGLCQLTIIGVIAIITARVTGGLTVPSGALAVAGLVLVWFVLGFAFYSSLFAAAGSLVPRQEELQNTMTPLSLVILASFFVAIAAINSPDTTLARVAALLPPSSPLVMPPRIVLGHSSPVEIVLAVLILLGSTAALVPIAGRIYRRAILRTGKVRIRDALRESDG